MKVAQEMNAFGSEFKYWLDMKYQNYELYESLLQTNGIPHHILKHLDAERPFESDHK